MSNQWTLASLHSYLQWVVGWQDSHAHEFHVGSRVVAPDWWIREMEFDTATCADERRVSVAAVANELGGGGAFEYHYTWDRVPGRGVRVVSFGSVGLVLS